MNAERLFAFYDRISDNPEAVPRIRKFVLDLAIRGKLVKQDPNDEPASETLKKIAASRPNTTKKERKSEHTLGVSELSGINFTLPLGWTLSRLSDLVQVLNGRAYKRDELLNSGTPVLRVGNLFTSNHWYFSNLELDENKYCDEGDLIYAWSASFGPFIWKGPRVIYHYHIWKLLLFSETHLSKQFLYFFLLQKSREIKDAGQGISMVHMTKKKMEQISVPIPPLAEQQRIVTKIDEFMVLCDKLEEARQQKKDAQDRLTKASFVILQKTDSDAKKFRAHARFMINVLPSLTIREPQIRYLRQTILNLAIRGRLAAQNTHDEPASRLIARLDTEIQRVRKKRQVRKRKSLTPFDDPPFDIPSSWCWSRVRDVTSDRGQKVPNKPFSYIDVSSIDKERGKVNAFKVLMPEEAPKRARKRVSRGDVIYSCTRPYLLNIAIIEQEIEPEPIVSTAFAVLNGHGILSARYLWIALRSPFMVHQVMERQRGQAYPAINDTEFAKLLVPVPPFAEQQRIVAKVDELLALCDNLISKLSVREKRQIELQESSFHHVLNQVSG